MRILRFLLVLLFATACGEAASSPDHDGAVVVASIHPVASMARTLLGDAGEVRTLLPPGVHADAFEPTPRMAESMAGADLVVRVGLGLDGWVGDAGAPELVLGEGLRGDGTPHVWLDPLIVRDHLLPRLTDALAEAVPAEAEGIRSRAVVFRDSITDLHAEITRLLQAAPARHFVAAHPAWEYFARRYGLIQVGVLHPSPGQEIGTRELARLVDRARELGVRAVIAEPQLGRGGVAAIADELDVRVEVADPIGAPGLDGREDYIPLMRYNATAFARALGGPT